MSRGARPTASVSRTAANGRQPDRQPGRVLEDDPLVRERPADADQRHPRPVEDRVERSRSTSARSDRRPAPLDRAEPPLRRVEAPRLRIDIGQALPKSLVTDVKRLQQIIKTCSPTRSSSRTRERCRSRLGRRSGMVGRQRRAVHASQVIAFSVSDTGIGISPDKADHLRGVPSGRRLDLAQVRRHRARPGHQPRAVAAPRRRDQARQQAGRGQHVHALPAAELQPGAQRAPARRERRRRRRAAGPVGGRHGRAGSTRCLHRNGRACRRGQQPVGR